MPSFNREKLQQLRDFIETHPENFLYETHYRPQNHTPRVCGTVGCVSGWAALFNLCGCMPNEYATKMAQVERNEIDFSPLRRVGYDQLSLEWLEVDPDLYGRFSEFLFYPWDFSDKNGDSANYFCSYKVALRRIDYLLDGGEISEYECDPYLELGNE